MQVSFIILFMIDLYKDNHVRAFVNFFFKKKTSPQKLLTGLLLNVFTSSFLKNQACGTIQALKRL